MTTTGQSAPIRPADLFRSIPSGHLYEVSVEPVEGGGLYMLRRSDDPAHICWEPADALLDPSKFRRMDRRLAEAAASVAAEERYQIRTPSGISVSTTDRADHVEAYRASGYTVEPVTSIHEEETTDGERAAEESAGFDAVAEIERLRARLLASEVERVHRAHECGDLRVQVEKLSRDLVQLGSGDLRAEIEAVREILCASPSETTEDAARSMLCAFRGIDSEITTIRAAIGAKEEERTMDAVARLLSAAAKARAA